MTCCVLISFYLLEIELFFYGVLGSLFLLYVRVRIVLSIDIYTFLCLFSSNFVNFYMRHNVRHNLTLYVRHKLTLSFLTFKQTGQILFIMFLFILNAFQQTIILRSFSWFLIIFIPGLSVLHPLFSWFDFGSLQLNII